MNDLAAADPSFSRPTPPVAPSPLWSCSSSGSVSPIINSLKVQRGMVSDVWSLRLLNSEHVVQEKSARRCTNHIIQYPVTPSRDQTISGLELTNPSGALLFQSDHDDLPELRRLDDLDEDEGVEDDDGEVRDQLDQQQLRPAKERRVTFYPIPTQCRIFEAHESPVDCILIPKQWSNFEFLKNVRPLQVASMLLRSSQDVRKAPKRIAL